MNEWMDGGDGWLPFWADRSSMVVVAVVVVIAAAVASPNVCRLIRNGKMEGRKEGSLFNNLRQWARDYNLFALGPAFWLLQQNLVGENAYRKSSRTPERNKPTKQK